MHECVDEDRALGKLKVQARVLAFIGPDSSRGRNAMIATGRQGKAFDLAQVLYGNRQAENSGWLVRAIDAALASRARSILRTDDRPHEAAFVRRREV
jgi:hypothetical protein